MVVALNNGGARGGRPRSLDPAGCLGLVLGYTRTRGSLFLMQMVFGVSHSVLCLFLKFSMRLLFKVLREEDSAKVCIPSAEEITHYQELIRLNFPALDGSWCVMDGLKIPVIANWSIMAICCCCLLSFILISCLSSSCLIRSSSRSSLRCCSASSCSILHCFHSNSSESCLC
jgi:hypothetical protein